jgi:hypothetical protein
VNSDARGFLVAFVLLALIFGFSPKIRMHPLSAGITNNTWSYNIVYRSDDGSRVVICDFMGHDSTPYWEGQSSRDDVVCDRIPEYVHQGLPPRVICVRYADGREIELRAPLVWGRLI